MDFFRIKQSPVAAEFCHNIHDIRRFPEFHDRRIACKNRCFHIFNMFAVKQRLSDNISQRKIRLCRKFGCRHRTMYGPYCGGPVPFHWQTRRCPVLPISIRSLLEVPLLIFNESKHRLKKTMPVCISSLLYIFLS